MLAVVAQAVRAFGPALSGVDQGQQFPPVLHAADRDFRLQRQCRGGERERFFPRSIHKQRVKFDSEAGGELAWPGVFGGPFLLGQRDRRGKLGVRGPLQRDDRRDGRPVIGVGSAGIQQAMKRLVGGVAGEVVVIAGVVISGSPPPITERADDGKPMGLLRQQRQMLAEFDPRSRSVDGLKGTAVLERRLGFEVPGVDVRSAPREEDHDGRLGPASPGFRGRRGGTLGQASPQSGEPGQSRATPGLQPGPAGNTPMEG